MFTDNSMYLLLVCIDFHLLSHSLIRKKNRFENKTECLMTRVKVAVFLVVITCVSEGFFMGYMRVS